MDPQAVWDRMLAALAAGDVAETAEAAGDLLTWLDRGGFPPPLFDRALPDAWRRAVVRAACLAARQWARRPTS